jgi:uncharacterized membrane protein YbhN (UPF0104 family)
MPTVLSPRHLARRLFGAALVIGTVAIIVAKLPGLGEVRALVRQVRPGWLAAVAAAEILSTLSYVVVFRGVFCRRMRWRLSAQVALAEEAANVLLPAGGAGGLALGAWALRQAGMSTEHIGRRTVAFFLVTSAANFVAVAIVGVAAAVGVLPLSVPRWIPLIPAALAVLVIAFVLWSPQLLDRLRREPSSGGGGQIRSLVRRIAGATSGGVDEAVSLLSSGSPMVILGAIGYVAFDVAALAFAFAAVAGHPAAGVLLLGYLVGQLGGLIPTPGGVGGTEGALVGAFVLFGSGASVATAAILPYRFFELWIPAVLGTAAFVLLRRTLKREIDPAQLCMAADKVRSAASTSPRAVSSSG